MSNVMAGVRTGAWPGSLPGEELHCTISPPALTPTPLSCLMGGGEDVPAVA